MVKAVVVLNSSEGVSGTVHFTQEGDGPTTVTGSVSGLKPGLHGFHVHALGDTTNGCMSTGPHFNPAGKLHGAPENENRHAGDLGNITVGADDTACFTIVDKQIPLCGPNSIIGRAVVVHGDPDDLAMGCNGQCATLFVIIAGGYLGFKTGWVGYELPVGYFPFGVDGMLAGAATVFFAYIGFDSVASTAEEVKNPQRDLTLGIAAALSICCMLYMLVSVVIVGLVPYYAMDPDTPISSAFASTCGMQRT
ncbi:superoxide dismutase [Cu-Zn] 1-like [Camellia sinensis]|uniref:Superoxide dismutase [Cu-Zn], chloroplastic n=1 Tax=Camellia sinensis var. sinensis TaxID=542762 RepID=A0A4S4EHT8_CAMSN|nr:superoxide dismutase [Cu-Zn] 1-like [Camellia sinensis]THG16053.1 hypothetical protein TEA_005588 [Camellia sinensis var. sinensis]